MRKLCIETTDQSSIKSKESVLVCRYQDANSGFGSSMQRYFQILVPMIVLTRLSRVLDHQIHQVKSLLVDECEHTNTDVVS